MMNQTVLVGRIVNDPELKELENGKKVANLCVAVSRSYKNDEGVYETDFINCSIWGKLAETTSEYCRKGDIVGLKGSLNSRIKEYDGIKHHELEFVPEKVTFLSSSSKEKEKNDDDLEM